MASFILLTPGFPADETDTTCLPAFQQFALSVRKLYPQYKLVVITFQYPFQKREYVWNGIRVIALGGSNRPLLRRIWIWVQAYAALKRLKKEDKIAGLLSLWLTECALVGKLFSKAQGLRHFIWLIGQDAKKSNQYIRRIRPKGREIIAMSDFLKEEYFQNHGELPFMIAENGIVTESFPPFNDGDRPIDILGVGSLIALKNYSLFVEIVSELKRQLPQIQAVIVGVGEEEEQLKALVEQLGLQQTVRFAGLQPHAKVFELMGQSKVFLHTSRYEGNSTVLMEALYSGCYTFSTRPLSDNPVEHLQILVSRQDFVTALSDHFRTSPASSRVVFNTMDASAMKIMNLYSG